MRATADLPLARALRSTGATLGEVFSFVSSLYFRGKIAYAAAFGDAATPPRPAGRQRFDQEMLECPSE